MCNTCGCGIGQTLIAGHALQKPRKAGEALRFRAHKERAEHAQPQGLTRQHIALDFGAGAAGAHAPGMSQSRMIRIERDILAKNNGYADENRHYLFERGIFTLNLVSSPGSGKTTLLVKTIEALNGTQPLAVIEGDQQTDNDAERIRAAGAAALQINTGKGCHLDAHMVGQDMQQLGLQDDSLLLIENVGNLVCPAEFDLGESLRVMVYSVVEGVEKPKKYPLMFFQSHVVLLNKMDLLPYAGVQLGELRRNLMEVNPRAVILPISCRSGEGLDAWIEWLKDWIDTTSPKGLSVTRKTA